MKTEPKEFQDLINCWQALPREEGQAPKKSTFSPARVARLLPQLFMLELVDTNRLCVRLIGSELESFLDSHLQSGSVLNTLLSEEGEYYEKLFQTCASQLCAGRVTRSLRTQSGLILDMDMLSLPLADADGTPRFVLGVAVLQRNRASSLKAMQEDAPRTRILGQGFIDLGRGVPERLPHMPDFNLTPVMVHMH